jgi:glycosyltransferase involved in cell wall biosynthesis
MAELPSISVVVPHYNDLEGLEKCLASLMAQTYPADRVEVLVADNASPQGIPAVEAVAAGRARVILVETRGAGPARNGAVAQATGDILAFIDSDCQARPDWLAQGIAALPAYDFIGGRVTVLVDDETRMTPVEAFERVFAFNFEHYITRMGFTGAGNLFCPRALFHAIGEFRTMVSEDVEWSRRGVAMGYRLGYAPLAVVGHPARRTWDELILKWRRVNSELFHLSQTGRWSRTRWLIRALGLPASALVHTPRVLFSDQLKGPRQRFDALYVLYGVRLWRLADAVALLGRNPRPAAQDSRSEVAP